MIKWCKKCLEEVQHFCTLICGSIFCRWLERIEATINLLHGLRSERMQFNPKISNSGAISGIYTYLLHIYYSPFFPTLLSFNFTVFPLCSWNMQRELYPSLLLFPAESKNAVPYEGDTAVSDIIKFIIDRGNNPSTIVKEKGVFFLNYWFPLVVWTLSSFSFSNWLYCVSLHGMVH